MIPPITWTTIVVKGGRGSPPPPPMPNRGSPLICHCQTVHLGPMSNSAFSGGADLYCTVLYCSTVLYCTVQYLYSTVQYSTS